MTPEIFHNIGVWTSICAALAVLVVVTSALFFMVGYAGVRVYERLTRVYHLSVIVYWLDRLEKEGTHCFQKAEGK